jgi:alpha-N-arabinofuranosidase
MYANELQERVAAVEVRAGRLTHRSAHVDVVDAIATVDKSGNTWAIALTNRHPSRDVACTVKMKETPLHGTYKTTLLTGDSPDACNDVEHPNRVTPKKMDLTFKNGIVDLPPHSLTVFHVPDASR